jgi:hypothetical protein
MKAKLFLTLFAILALGIPIKAQNNLYITDPTLSWSRQSGVISEASLSVHPKGLYLEYGLYMTFSASQTYYNDNVNLETVLDFTLPKGAIVIDSWLWVGEDIVQGKLIDRWSASDIYEGIVNRQRDPSVLYKNSDTQYQLRVYPMKKKETRKVKITYLMPVEWQNGEVEASIPSNIIFTSFNRPNFYILLWEEKGFVNPVFSDPQIIFESKTDTEFGNYKKANVQPHNLQPVMNFQMEAPVQNGIYLSVYEDESTSYYQMSLSPGSFITQIGHQRILVLIDEESGNSSVTRGTLISNLKQQLLANYGENDSFNLIYSKLQVVQASDTWKPINLANLTAALDPLLTESLYSNLPGMFATAFDFLEETGGQGSILLLTNSDNFGNYEQANALIKDLKKLQDPLPPVYIADYQDLKLDYYYIGNRFYYGQEYLYVNLSKASAGYYKGLRTEQSFTSVLSDVVGSLEGMVTAFDVYTAPTDGFCYGRFGTENLQGFPINQSVTQIGKFFGQTPFMIYLTGMYKGEPFSQLVEVTGENVAQADTMLSKMWHGRYISNLENAETNNMIVQEVLYESLNNRVLSKYSAFLCLEPSDTISACLTCKDESRLVGIDDRITIDSTGFVKLYPNPFKEKLTMEISVATNMTADKVMINIFNVSGQLVYQNSLKATPGQVLVTEWPGVSTSGNPVPAGQYFVMIKAGEFVMSKQIIKSE